MDLRKENANSLSFETVKQKGISKSVLNTVLYLFIFALLRIFV